MRFFVLADRRKILTSDALKSVNRALQELAKTLNLLRSKLYEEGGSGDSDALLLPVGARHPHIDVDYVQTCGVVVWEDVTKDRRGGDALEDAVRTCGEAYWNDIDSDHSPRLVLLLGAPPTSWDALSDALNEWPDEASQPLVISCTDDLAPPPSVSLFRVVPERSFGFSAFEAWCLPTARPTTRASATPPASTPSLAIVTIPSLQSVVDGSKQASSIPLRSGEYYGGCTITHSVTLEGESAVAPASILGSAGPALVLAAPDITLRNLLIEATPGGVAIERRQGASQLCLQQVTVRGRVQGIPGEDGEWDIPESLELGALPANASTSRVLLLDTPVSCMLHSPVSGFRLEPTRIEAGVTRVVLHISTGTAGAVVFGYLILRSECFMRRVHVVGHCHAGTTDSPGAVLWSCKRPIATQAAAQQGSGSTAVCTSLRDVGSLALPTPASAAASTVETATGQQPAPVSVAGSEYALRVTSTTGMDEQVVPTDGLSIGSAQGNHLCLTDPHVGAWHAYVCMQEGQLVIRDLGSPHGTFLRGAKINQVALVAGDIVTIGVSTLEVVQKSPVVGNSTNSARTVPAVQLSGPDVSFRPRTSSDPAINPLFTDAMSGLPQPAPASELSIPASVAESATSPSQEAKQADSSLTDPSKSRRSLPNPNLFGKGNVDGTSG